MLGDGVWEGLRVHRGVVVFAAEHLERLWEGEAAVDALRRIADVLACRRPRDNARGAAGAPLLCMRLESRDPLRPAQAAPLPPLHRAPHHLRPPPCHPHPPGCKALDMEIGLTQRQLLAFVYQTLDANGMGAATGVHIRLMVGWRGPPRVGQPR
jgi:hypothetical protein